MVWEQSGEIIKVLYYVIHNLFMYITGVQQIFTDKEYGSRTDMTRGSVVSIKELKVQYFIPLNTYLVIASNLNRK